MTSLWLHLKPVFPSHISLRRTTLAAHFSMPLLSYKRLWWTGRALSKRALKTECASISAHRLDPVIANFHRRKRRKPRFTTVDFETRLYWITNHWKPKVHGALKKSSSRPFALWHHFTITTRILQGFAFLCKWGLLFFKPHWDNQI